MVKLTHHVEKKGKKNRFLINAESFIIFQFKG